MIPHYVQIDMGLVSINTGNNMMSLCKATIGLEIHYSTHHYTVSPLCPPLLRQTCAVNLQICFSRSRKSIGRMELDLWKADLESRDQEKQCWIEKAKPIPKNPNPGFGSETCFMSKPENGYTTVLPTW